MRKVVNRIVYDTEKAQLLASTSETGDPPAQGKSGYYLYRGRNGRYFQIYDTKMIEDYPRITVLTQSDAEGLYSLMSYQHIPFEEAFPDIELEEA